MRPRKVAELETWTNWWHLDNSGGDQHYAYLWTDGNRWGDLNNSVQTYTVICVKTGKLLVDQGVLISLFSFDNDNHPIN